jgi:SpoVK/Ycf46/Vps4 family AAA+-type ATPase
MRGLTLNEVRHLIFRLAAENKLGTDAATEDISSEKAQIILKESCLRLIPVRPGVSTIGGLENLKDWVAARARLFSKEAYDAGIPLPSGVLFMGVSGCGKSLAAKAISLAWDLPLVRLDMNLIFSGVYGTPEYAFDRACRIAEAVAPVVLWIDEIENAFGYDEGPATGGNINIFSSFLTWMQEKPASVFVAATANRIHKLPAEMIRKGRFDQLFFLDLPIDTEREDIFRIHIEKNGGRVEDFDLGVLAAVTRERTGAEIEQIVKAARVEAFTENRTFTQRDIAQSSNRIVPLSKTMREQIKQLRDWSYDRAAPASRKTG